MEKVFNAIILCAGSSSRMGTGKSKILEKIGGKAVLQWTLEAFQKSLSIKTVTITCRETELETFKKLAAGYSKAEKFVIGGNTRQESVMNSVRQNLDSDFFVIHDGARPLITPEQIDMLCADALIHGASAIAAPSKDTFKKIDENGFIIETVSRENLVHVQTPQVFSKELYLRGVEKAKADGKDFTDDCQLIENLEGGSACKVHLVMGDHKNIKITSPEDILTASAYLERKKKMRIGHGYDVHKLVEGRKLILGGIEIPYEKGLLGHSDADVLLHAISDAILGAAALGDIGRHFPDNDDSFKGADSMVLLKKCVELVDEKGYKPVNIDCTIVMQRPKLAGYIDEMRDNVSHALGIALDDVSIKATTEEGLGFTGDGSAASAHAVCLLTEK